MFSFSPNISLNLVKISEALSSDQDDVDEINTSSYLDNMKNFATKGGARKGLDISAEIKVIPIIILNGP